jgi:hypothetical protein
MKDRLFRGVNIRGKAQVSVCVFVAGTLPEIVQQVNVRPAPYVRRAIILAVTGEAQKKLAMHAIGEFVDIGVLFSIPPLDPDQAAEVMRHCFKHAALPGHFLDIAAMLFYEISDIVSKLFPRTIVNGLFKILSDTRKQSRHIKPLPKNQLFEPFASHVNNHRPAKTRQGNDDPPHNPELPLHIRDSRLKAKRMLNQLVYDIKKRIVIVAHLFPAGSVPRLSGKNTPLSIAFTVVLKCSEFTGTLFADIICSFQKRQVVNTHFVGGPLVFATATPPGTNAPLWPIVGLRHNRFVPAACLANHFSLRLLLM